MIDFLFALATLESINFTFWFATMVNEKKLVVKHNNLINARYNFSLSEMKLFLMAVSQIKANDVLFSKYRIYVKDFIQAIGTSSKDEYSRVKETVESLMKKIVEIPSLNEDKVLLCQLF